MLELRDLYDKNSNKTDKTYRKWDIFPDGYHIENISILKLR